MTSQDKKMNPCCICQSGWSSAYCAKLPPSVKGAPLQQGVWVKSEHTACILNLDKYKGPRLILVAFLNGCAYFIVENGHLFLSILSWQKYMDTFSQTRLEISAGFSTTCWLACGSVTLRQVQMKHWSWTIHLHLLIQLSGITLTSRSA